MRAGRGRRAVLLAGLALLAVPLAACDPNPAPACDRVAEPTFSVAQAGDLCEPPPECDDCGGIHGDPHITTHDDRYYNLMVVGEFVAAEGADTRVQVRFGPYGDSRTVSVLSGVAFDLGGAALSITLDSTVLNDEMSVAIDGDAVDLTERPWVRGPHRVDLTDAGQLVVRSGEGLLAVVEEWGYWLDLSIRIDDEVRGVLGSNDGDPDNDLTTRDGVDLGTGPSIDELHDDFAESWRIDDDESLFDYGPGESTATFTDRTFPDEAVTLDDLTAEQRASAEEICRAAGVTDPTILDACILDVAVTGDPTLAESAAAMQRRLGRDGDATDPTDGAPVAATGARWSTTLTGVDGGAVRPIATDGTSLFVSGVVEGGRGVLTSLDASTGEEQWRVVGVQPRCGVGVLGDDRLVVVGQEGGPLASTESASLVVLDRSTGRVADRVAWEDAPSTYCSTVQVVDGIAVVPDELGRMTGWDLSGPPEVAWRRELPGLARDVASVDDLVVGLRSGDDGAVVVFLLDPVTGEERDGLEVRGRDPVGGRHLLVHDDGLVVSLRGDAAGARTGTTTGVSVDDGELAVDWEVASPLVASDTDGDLLVGYIGDELVRLDLDDGRERWRFDPPAFRNSASPVAVMGGVVHELAFGGPFLLEISSEGEVVRERTGDELFGDGGPAGATWLGPTLGDLLVAQARDDAGDLVVVGVAPGA